jgi:hypothetical protein
MLYAICIVLWSTLSFFRSLGFPLILPLKWQNFCGRFDDYWRFFKGQTHVRCQIRYRSKAEWHGKFKHHRPVWVTLTGIMICPPAAASFIVTKDLWKSLSLVLSIIKRKGQFPWLAVSVSKSLRIAFFPTENWLALLDIQADKTMQNLGATNAKRWNRVNRIVKNLSTCCVGTFWNVGAMALKNKQNKHSENYINKIDKLYLFFTG